MKAINNNQKKQVSFTQEFAIKIDDINKKYKLKNKEYKNLFE